MNRRQENRLDAFVLLIVSQNNILNTEDTFLNWFGIVGDDSYDKMKYNHRMSHQKTTEVL